MSSKTQLIPDSTLQGGKYRILSVLGQGGFGITYEAEQVALGRKVAVKEFFMEEYCNRDSTTSQVLVGSEGSKVTVERFRTKFIKEAKMIAGLNNPHIVKIYDIFEENGTAYYVMEYHDNGSLKDEVAKRGALLEKDAVKRIREVADALQYLHNQNILHLDVKPANILRGDNGEMVLIDFGVSKCYDEDGEQTSSTPVAKSKGYAPSELYISGSVSHFSPATDIYSLGATFYHLVTGMVPPDTSVVSEEGIDLSKFAGISEPIRNAIEAAMRYRRKDRPQSIAEFLRILDGSPNFGTDDERTISAEAQIPFDDENPDLSSDRTDFDDDESYLERDNINPTVQFAGTSALETKSSWISWCIIAFGVLFFLGCFILVIYTDVVGYGDMVSQENVSKVTGTIDGHEYVDLGLSVKWATCNVGASSPSDYGYYFAWGEVCTKTEYTNKNSVTYNKTMDDIAGNSTYDAARHNWGGKWRLPTKVEYQELVDNCRWNWIELDGVKGYKVTSKKNGASIFLPAAGWQSISSLYYADELCYYWSSTPDESTAQGAYGQFFYMGDYRVGSHDRGYGHNVRPVSDFNLNLTNATTGEATEEPNAAFVDNADEESETTKFYVTTTPADATVTIDGNSVGKTPIKGRDVTKGSHSIKINKDGYETYIAKVTFGEDPVVVNETLKEKPRPNTGTHNGHEYVDLGLSVKWATCNVGASSPVDYGNYYAWGEVRTKTEYTEDNSLTNNRSMGDISGNSTYDAARYNWGGKWRLPSEDECNELAYNCTWSWATQGGHNGYKVTSKRNGASIFLPATGCRMGYSLKHEDDYSGFYWSSKPDESDSWYAYSLYTNSSTAGTAYSLRYCGRTVRPVLD